jgi:hypothetical protein
MKDTLSCSRLTQIGALSAEGLFVDLGVCHTNEHAAYRLTQLATADWSNHDICVFGGSMGALP